MEENEMIYEKIAEIISDKMDIDADEITMDSTFESLKIDSLDMVEIVMDIEEEFDVSVEDAENLKSVADLVKYIEDNK
ncbi:putative acyl carrier protein [Christensenella minuta]|jgi:acyl carrier protein|uniref:Acyl carrier protein n=2 Tax=Christensenella TaxID=990721 RepID=A0A136Q1G8_9FIRM|nr:putative acyl carrier protein [Christensenella minuta]